MIAGLLKAVFAYAFPYVLFGIKGVKQREEEGKSNILIGILFLIATLFWALAWLAAEKSTIGILIWALYPISIIVFAILYRIRVKKKLAEQEQEKAEFKSGAFTSKYAGFPFACDTSRNVLIRFDPALQRDAFGRFVTNNGMTEEEVLAILNNPSDDEQDESIRDYCRLLKVNGDNDQIVMEPITERDEAFDVRAYSDFLSVLNYQVRYKHYDKNGGVYYVDTF